MKIAIDICHPAHVHFFRNSISLMQQHGHDIYITARNKDCTIELLQQYDLEFNLVQTPIAKGFSGLTAELFKRNIALKKEIQKFAPDIITAVGGIFAAHVSKMLKIPSVIFYDGDNAWMQNFLTYPLADLVVTPRNYNGWTPSKKTLKYHGLQEAAYLHPNRFIANREIAIKNGLDAIKDTFIIRLVKKTSNHDLFATGIGFKNLKKIINKLQNIGKVIILSEISLPNEFSPYLYRHHKSEVHHLLKFAKLIVSESPTMASEACLLGTPAIYVNSITCSNVDMLQRYNMAKHIKKPRWNKINSAIDNIINTNSNEIEQSWQQLLLTISDVTPITIDCIENFKYNKQLALSHDSYN